MNKWLKWLKDFVGGGAAVPVAVALFATLQGCAVDQASGAPDEPIFATGEGALSTWTQLYFGQSGQASGTAKQPAVEFRFDANKGGTFQLQVSASKPLSSIEVKLYKQSASGWSFQKSAVSKAGSTVLTGTPTVGGTYRAVVTANPAAQQVNAALACTKGSCSAGGQPGASCGSRGQTPCAAGLFCNYQPGALCGMADAPGTCATKPQMCTMIYKPVCGCDGKTYGNSCSAAAAGIGVMTDGACCTDKSYAPKAIALTDLVGEWGDLDDGKYASQYTFLVDGTFTRTDAVSPCPAGATCIWSGIVSNGGTFKLNGSSIALTWNKPQAGNWGLLFPASVQSTQMCTSWHLNEKGGAAEVFGK